MSRPGVLHVLEAIGGGTARHLVDLVRHGKDFRHAVVIPSRRMGGVSDEHAASHIRDARAEINTIEMRRRPWSPTNARAFAQVYGVVRRDHPAVLHGHGSVGGAIARAVGAVTRTPVVWTPHGVLVHPASVMVERLLRPVTSRVIAVSESEARLVLDLRLASSQRICVIPNGIERHARPFVGPSLRDRLKIGDDALLVGTVSRLTPQKSPEQLLDAWRIVAPSAPSAHLVWIGTGPDTSVMERALAELPRTHWIPNLPDAALYLGDLDVFVLASRYEGAPYAPLEAMRMAVPPILTDVVGNRDVVEHGVDGFLVEPMNPAVLANTITGLLGSSELRKRIGEAARRTIDERHDVESMARDTESLYRTILEEGRHGRQPHS